MLIRKRNLERLLEAAYRLGFIAATQEAIEAAKAQEDDRAELDPSFVEQQRRSACQQ